MAIEAQRKINLELTLDEHLQEVSEFLDSIATWPWMHCAPAGTTFYDCDEVEGFPYRPSGSWTWTRYSEDRTPWLCGEYAAAAAYAAAGKRAVLLPAGWKNGTPPAFEAHSWAVSPQWPDNAIFAGGSVNGASVEFMVDRMPSLRTQPTYAKHYMGTSRREVMLGFRLGHVAHPLADGVTVRCVFCGEITGPASGVVEHTDGSLSWTREDSTEVMVPPVNFMPKDWQAPGGRPPMSKPSEPR